MVCKNVLVFIFCNNFLSMNDNWLVKICNSERMHKIKSNTQIDNRRNRSNANYKCFSYLQINKVMKQYGYQYETHSPVLKEIK